MGSHNYPIESTADILNKLQDLYQALDKANSVAQQWFVQFCQGHLHSSMWNVTDWTRNQLLRMKQFWRLANLYCSLTDVRWLPIVFCHWYSQLWKLLLPTTWSQLTRMYQHILSLCMFSNTHGWLIQDNISPADSFVLLSAVWPSDFAPEHAQCHFMLIHPRTTVFCRNLQTNDKFQLHQAQETVPSYKGGAAHETFMNKTVFTLNYTHLCGFPKRSVRRVG